MRALSKTFPGKVIEINSQEEFDAFNQPHTHVFQSDDGGGVVIGSSIWWVIDIDNKITQHTRIKGLICKCGSILMFDED